MAEKEAEGKTHKALPRNFTGADDDLDHYMRKGKKGKKGTDEPVLPTRDYRP